VTIREALVTFTSHVGRLLGSFRRLTLLNAGCILGFARGLVWWGYTLELTSGNLANIVEARANTVIISVANVNFHVLRLLVKQ